MKKEKKANNKAQQEFESSFFNTARNLIQGELSLLPRHFVFPTVSNSGEREMRTGDEAQGTSGELLYQVTHGLQLAQAHYFRTSEPRKVCSCLCVIVKAN